MILRGKYTSMKFTNSFLIFLIGGLILFFPYLYLGQDTPVTLSDHLDSNHVWYKILKDQGHIFSSGYTPIDGFLGNQYRFSYPSGFSVTAFLYCLLPVFEAFWINKVLIFILGFWGMYLLLSRRFQVEKTDAGFMSLLWASCSFYPFLGAGIAMIPGVLYVFFIRKKIIYPFLLAFFLFPFYSETVLLSLFIWVSGSLYFLARCFFVKRIEQDLVLPLLAFTLAILIKDHQLLLTFFSDGNFVSHRTEIFYDEKQGQNVIEWFQLVIIGVFTGNSYWFGIGVAFFLLLLWNLRGNNPDILPHFLFAISFGLAAIVSMLSFPEVLNWFGTVFSPLRSFNITRFFNLISPIWFLGFFISTNSLTKIIKRGLLIFLFMMQIGLVNYEWRSLLKSFWDNPNWSPNPTYREFFSEKAYEKIKMHLPLDYKGYIGHLNVPPAISAFNGLKTIDGYLVNYKLSHKHSIGKVITEEIKKDQTTHDLFQNWGNKAYLLNSSNPEWVFNFKTIRNPPIYDLDFDWNYLKYEMKTKYIISSGLVQIDKLKLIYSLKHPESCWNLFLYEVLD
jgi:hypothetical protein